MRPAVLALGLSFMPLQALAVPTARPQVLNTFPHDVAAFTQGLLLHDGTLFESTGLAGRSSVRKVEPSTGEVRESIPLPATEFGEGLALVEERLIQLTWKNGVAHVYDLSLTDVGSFTYQGEGWGLCFDGQRLVMSDGSSSLFFRDPATFELLGSVVVKADGAPVDELNELECVGSLVYANVWQTDTIVRIDPSNGEVLTNIDASGLLTVEEDRRADVLNGIAYDSTTGHFLLTGKLWPKVFEVRFDFDAGSRDGGAPGGGAASASPRTTRPMTPSPASPSPAMPSNDSPRETSGCALSAKLVPKELSTALVALLPLLLMRLRRRSRWPLAALLLVSCSSNQHITQTGSSQYRIRCETALSRCLEQLDLVCPEGFELREAVEKRQRLGVDAVGTGVETEKTSEALAVCRSTALVDLDEPEAPPPWSGERICTPGATQECTGGGGCRGGQACLSSGQGYGHCDCVLGVPVPAPSATEGKAPAPEPTPSTPPLTTPTPLGNDALPPSPEVPTQPNSAPAPSSAPIKAP